jgi:hypothetical protein
MARKSAKRSPGLTRAWRICAPLAAVLLLTIPAAQSRACPFCTALRPSLAQLRQSAAVVALAEVIAPPSAAEAKTRLRLHETLQGQDRIPSGDELALTLDVSAKPGQLLLLFGTSPEESNELAWHAVAVDETSYAYFRRAPSLATAAHERLRYFGRFLEHADPVIAEDAYLEFGHAPFDEVARAADILSTEKLRAWLVDPRVPQARKGFYGLAIALAAPPAERTAIADFLRSLVVAPDDDFRAGFDGMLGGYLLLAGNGGLELIESRFLANPKAADGDVRHAMTALRFTFEYGHDIPPARLSQALAALLAREEFAAAAITDLARWKAWDHLDQVVEVYRRSGAGEGARRAAIGFLLACPDAPARAALAALRAGDPVGVAAAERALAQTSSLPDAQ